MIHWDHQVFVSVLILWNAFGLLFFDQNLMVSLELMVLGLMATCFCVYARQLLAKVLGSRRCGDTVGARSQYLRLLSQGLGGSIRPNQDEWTWLVDTVATLLRLQRLLACFPVLVGNWL